jgi:hypothetical protein
VLEHNGSTRAYRYIYEQDISIALLRQDTFFDNRSITPHKMFPRLLLLALTPAALGQGLSGSVGQAGSSVYLHSG